VPWVLTAAAVLAASLLLGAVGLPAPALFAALAVGLVAAVSGLPRRGSALVLPRWTDRAAQACLGVLTGALVQPETLRALGRDWLPVGGAVLATLVISVLAGLALGRRRDVGPVTGSFALVAGGASGITAISAELGADQRVVAVVQYLRVLVVVLTMPVVATALPRGSALGPAAAAGAPLWADLALTAGAAAAGLALARLVRLPAGSLLGPMLLTAALSGAGWSGGAGVPDAVMQVAYAVIGLQVGLSFTRESLRAVRSVLPTALALTVALIVVTAAVGVPLLGLAGASVLDAYLATTPGGLYAVLATAVDTGADTTLVLAVQVLRLLVMLLLAPVLAVALSRWRPA